MSLTSSNNVAVPETEVTSEFVEALEDEAIKLAQDSNATPRDKRCAFRLALNARSMLLKRQIIAVRREKIAQLERREKAAKAAAHNSRLSAEEKALRIRQILNK